MAAVRNINISTSDAIIIAVLDLTVVLDAWVDILLGSRLVAFTITIIALALVRVDIYLDCVKRACLMIFSSNLVYR